MSGIKFVSGLKFDEVAHRYTFDGVVVPSVTQVLRPLYDFGAIPPQVLQAKAAIGTAVHRACELIDADDLDDESPEGQAALAPIAGYLAGYRKFKADKNPTVLANEQRLYHPLHRYAGTTDRRYAFGGHVWDIDIKSTASMSPIVGLQTAAYQAMFQAQGDKTPSRRGALQLLPDGSYKLWEFSDPSDFSVFLSLLTVQRFKERHAL